MEERNAAEVKKSCENSEELERKRSKDIARRREKNLSLSFSFYQSLGRYCKVTSATLSSSLCYPQIAAQRCLSSWGEHKDSYNSHPAQAPWDKGFCSGLRGKKLRKGRKANPEVLLV